MQLGRFQELTHSTRPQKHSQSSYLHLQPQKLTHSTLQPWPPQYLVLEAHLQYPAPETHQLRSLKLSCSTWSLKPTRNTQSTKLVLLSPAPLACFGFLSQVLWFLFNLPPALHRIPCFMCPVFYLSFQPSGPSS
ncbi:hypothetical protein SKAU_G00271040 [Synaphobranchus kaupii]|uniref:Uncharacterized protein n=1 Tax=Synaphobranchus kaupii TaxID=118154 RepID=A0A9Q1F0H1_SYNKA|nr:hypothetical protein SKAU_G00271040 [Synaphobranchus kaupii]